MNVKLAIALFSVLAILQGCSKDPISVEVSSNTNVTVDFLFEHDGCKLYRFVDGGKPIYYAKCRESTQTTWNSTNLAGKVVVTVPHQVSTQIVP